jgi:hypothetical protein
VVSTRRRGVAGSAAGWLNLPTHAEHSFVVLD